MFCGVCGRPFPDDFNFCPKCGRPVSTSALVEAPQAVAVAPAPEVEPDTKDQKSTPSGPVAARFNYGTVVFAAFSVLSLLVCLAKGIVPLYLGESVLWAVVAWYWHKKSPWSDTATGIVLLLAVGFAAGEGYLIGRQSLGSSYTYLTQGNLQYRVNARTGRTDVLAGIRGWEPVSFDRPPATIPADEAQSIALSNGTWENVPNPLDAKYGKSSGTGQICFYVQNNSHYVLQEVTIRAYIGQLGFADTPGSPGGPAFVMLKKEFGGLLDVGKASRFCGDAPYPLPTGEKWDYWHLPSGGPSGTAWPVMTGWK